MVLPLNPAFLENLNDALHEFRQIGAVPPFRVRSVHDACVRCLKRGTGPPGA
jgi:hypothetical protein